jgi:hypothetical protein
MALVLVILLLILILGGVGLAAAKLLLWIALIMLVVWIVGFLRAAQKEHAGIDGETRGELTPRFYPSRPKV